MTTHVDVFVGPGHDLGHTSLVLTGLCALAARGSITLTYRRQAADADRWHFADAVVVVLDVRHAQNRVQVAIDLRDGEGVSGPALDHADRYFKRSYLPAECSRLGKRGEKIVPFGFNFPCRSARSTARLLGTIGGPIVLTGTPGLRRLKAYLATPPPSAFEQSPDVPVDPLVVFQPRLWAEDEVAAGEAAALNYDRVMMVRALKREFGPRFMGGIVATPYAKTHYPDDLTPHSSEYVDYLRFKKRCLVSVYTRGVEHSLAFKLGETFAASQCLVSVPLHYDLPAPLEQGTHYLEFANIDGCLDACRRLLNQPQLAQSMRRANHAYYRRQIEPAAHMAWVIDAALGASEAA